MPNTQEPSTTVPCGEDGDGLFVETAFTQQDIEQALLAQAIQGEPTTGCQFLIGEQGQPGLVATIANLSL